MSFSDSDLDLDDDGVLRDHPKGIVGDEMVMDEFGIIHDATDVFSHFEPTQRTDSGLGADKRSTTSTGRLTDFNFPHDALQAYDTNDSHPLDEKSLNISDFEDSTARDSLKEPVLVDHVSLSSEDEPELMFNNTFNTQNTSIQQNGSHFHDDHDGQFNMEDLRNQGVISDDDFNDNSEDDSKRSDLLSDHKLSNGLDVEEDCAKVNLNSDRDLSFGQDLKNQGVITDDDSLPLYSHSLLEFENLEAKMADDSMPVASGDDPLADYLHKTPRRHSGGLITHELTFSSSNITAEGDDGKEAPDDDFTISEHSSVDPPLSKTSHQMASGDKTGLNLSVMEHRNASIDQTLLDQDIQEVKFPDSFSRHSTPQPSKIPRSQPQSPSRSRSSSPIKVTMSRGNSPTSGFKSRLPVRTPSPSLRNRSRGNSPSLLLKNQVPLHSVPPSVHNLSRGSSPELDFRSRLPIRSESPATRSRPISRTAERGSRQSSQSPGNRDSHPHVRSQSRQSVLQSPMESDVDQAGRKHSYSSNRPRSRSASRANTPDIKPCMDSRSQSPLAEGSRRGSKEVSDIMASQLVSSLNGAVKDSNRSNSAPVQDQKLKSSKSSRPGSAKISKNSKPNHSESLAYNHSKPDIPKMLVNRPETPKHFKIKGSSVANSNTAKDTRLKPIRATQSSQEFSQDRYLSQSHSEAEDRFSLSQLSNPSSGGRRRDDELVHQLQDEYDKLLEKYALAEVTIDQLKLGAKIRLHSDPPTPAQASRGVVAAAQKSQVIQMPTVGKAQVGHIGLPMQGKLHNVVTPGGHSGNLQVNGSSAPSMFPSHHDSFHGHPLETSAVPNSAERSDVIGMADDNPLLTATTSGECAKMALIFQARSLEEQLDSFTTLLNEEQLTLVEQERVCERIRTDLEQLQHDYRQARDEHDRVRRQNVLASGGSQVFFDNDKSLEGELFKLGMKLEGVHEKVEDNLKQQANQRRPFQDDRAVPRSESGNALSPLADAQSTPPGETQGDHVTNLENKVEQLLDEYNALIGRYNELKSLPATQSRDAEIDALLRRLHEISAQSPRLLNVQLPEILPAQPTAGAGGGLLLDTSDSSEPAKAHKSEKHAKDPYVSSSAAEEAASQSRPSKVRTRQRKPNPDKHKNPQNGHSSVADSGVSTPADSRKSAPRAGSHVTTDGDSGFMGSEGSRQSRDQALGKLPRLKGLRSSVKATELSSVTSNQQEWSGTDVSTTESVKPQADARTVRGDRSNTRQEEPASSRVSSRRVSVDSTKRQRHRASTPDTDKSFVSQRSRASSRSSVKSERLNQLQNQIEQLRLELQKSKQTEDTHPKAVASSGEPHSSGVRQHLSSDVGDGVRHQAPPGVQNGHSVDSTSGQHERSPLDEKYLSGSVRPAVNPHQPLSETDSLYNGDYYSHGDNFPSRGSAKYRTLRDDGLPDYSAGMERLGHSGKYKPQPRDYSNRGGKYYGGHSEEEEEKLRRGYSRLHPERDERYGHHSPEFKTTPEEMDRGDRQRRPPRHARSYGNGDGRRELPMDYSGRHYEDRFTSFPDRKFSRGRLVYESTPKRRNVARDYYRTLPLEGESDGTRSHMDESADEKDYRGSRPPPLSRDELDSTPNFGTRTVNGYTLTKSPCPVCAGSGVHTHAEFNPAHRPSRHSHVAPSGETRQYHPQASGEAALTSSHVLSPSDRHGAQFTAPPPAQHVNYGSTPLAGQIHMPQATAHPPQYAFVHPPASTTLQPQVYPTTPVNQTVVATPQSAPVPAPQPVLHSSQSQPANPQTLMYPSTPLYAVYPATPVHQITPAVVTPQAAQSVSAQTPVVQSFTPASALLLTSGQAVAQEPSVAQQHVQLVTPSSGQAYVPVELQSTPLNASTQPVTSSSKVRYYVREYKSVDSDADSVESKRKSKQTKKKRRQDDDSVIVLDKRQTSFDDASRAALELKVLTEKMRSSLKDELNRSIKYTTTLPFMSTLN